MTYCYFSETKDACLNLATEQYLQSSFPGERVLFLWQNCQNIPEGVLPGGEGIIGFTFFSRNAQVNRSKDFTVLQKALESLDIPAKVEKNAIWVHNCAVTYSEPITKGQNTIHRGIILFNPKSDVLGDLEYQCKYPFASIASGSPFLSRSFLLASVKYAYECMYGKSMDLSPDVEEILLTIA